MSFDDLGKDMEESERKHWTAVYVVAGTIGLCGILMLLVRLHVI